MFLLFLSGFPLLAIAYPSLSDGGRLQLNKERLTKALVNFGSKNFTWPELELLPMCHCSLMKNQTELEEKLPWAGEEGLDDPIDDQRHPDYIDDDGQIEQPDTEEDIICPEGKTEIFPLREPETTHVKVNEKPVYILHHPANDNPADLESDAYHFFDYDGSQPICGFFQHSVLGEDFGASTFPRVSYVSSEPLPFRVHYAPDDDLRFESYKWPFAACNYGCELQALKIRAMFDWELDPVNENSNLDEETKQALRLGREICQWKNVHHHFAITDYVHGLRKRFVSPPLAIWNSSKISTISSPSSSAIEWKPVRTNFTRSGVRGQNPKVAQLSDAARAAMQEIQTIFASTKGPKDLARMFHVVTLACQIHRYTSTPMSELRISTPQSMVQQAMRQIGCVFADTQERIDVWETRDAIVRATQIYRYEADQSRSF